MMTKPISPRTKKPFNARNLSSSSMMGYMFIFPAVFALTALVVYPICYGVYISFFKTNLANKWNFVGLKNYISLFKTSEFTGDLLLTLKFALIVVFFHFLIGGIPDLTALVVCILATLVGARASALFANKAESMVLNRVTGVVLAVLGAAMIVVKFLV